MNNMRSKSSHLKKELDNMGYSEKAREEIIRWYKVCRKASNPKKPPAH
jgi:hypothetical protein